MDIGQIRFSKSSGRTSQGLVDFGFGCAVSGGLLLREELQDLTESDG